MPHFLAALAGASLTLSLAPFHAWWLAPLPLALLVFLAERRPQHAFRYSLFFFCGYFLSGSSWVYVSMHEHGNLNAPLAGLVTILFALLMGLLSALPFRWRRLWLGSLSRLLLGFPAAMIASEWLRTWIFTGFPWLFIGYSQTETVLGSLAPVFGVLGVSASVCLIAASLSALLLFPSKRTIAAGALVVTGAASLALNQINWSAPQPAHSQTVALVQGNIPQQLRWDANQLAAIKASYLSLSAPLWSEVQLVVWPEAAVPEVLSGRIDVLDHAFEQALAHGSGLITGVPSAGYDPNSQRTVLRNSVLGIGMASGIYHKQRLVPFGEYVPFADYIGPVFDLLRVPMSDFRTGPKDQPNLQTGRFELAADVCYEVAYPILIAKQASTAGAMLTISNDAWFGASIGPHQHLQMAQMRARENARPMMRATNNGITAFINAQGSIEQRAPQFERAVIQQVVTPYQGSTPFQRWLHWPLLLITAVALVVFRKPMQ